MKTIDRSSIVHLVAILTIGANLVACSTVSKVKRVDRSADCDCDPGTASLYTLLEHAVEDPESHSSTHALAYFVEKWHGERGGSNVGILESDSNHDDALKYRVRMDSPDSRFQLSYFDEISPAYDYDVEKLEHHRRKGFGAPLVALRENNHRTVIESYYPPEAITRPLTAVIRAGATVDNLQEVQIDFMCPLQNNTIRIDGEDKELAADLSVPWAAMLSRSRKLKRSELRDFVDSTPNREPRLYLMEPYDPNKEPLIMIHGLLGSPLLWAQLSNTLWADDEIRSRYQIWHFHYNTSAPALYSGRILREQLKKVRTMLDPSETDPAMQSTTVIAHSMGGIVTRSLLTKPGNAFWDAAFTQSFESLKLSDSDRASLKEAFFWTSSPHVKRVIYIAASHQGSDFADNPIGYLGRLIARPPKDGFANFYERISQANPGAFTEAYEELGKGKLNSVHALSPRQPSLPILAKLPNNHPVREFSIIGNQGKPGPLEESSDGIVPYWSSHIDRAESEKIVPAPHYSINHEETVAEVKRILKLP